MSWADNYRSAKVEYESEDSWEEEQIGQALGQSVDRAPVDNTMDPSQIQALIDNAVRQALSQQQSQFQVQLNSLAARVQSLQVEAPQIVTYEKVSVNSDVRCEIQVPKMSMWPGGNRPYTPTSCLNHTMAAVLIIRLLPY